MTRIDEQTPVRKRWAAQEPGQSVEKITGELFRLAAETPEISDQELAAIHTQLREKVRARSGTPFRSRHAFLRPVFITGVVLLLGGGVIASALPGLLRKPPRIESPTPPAQPKNDIPKLPAIPEAEDPTRSASAQPQVEAMAPAPESAPIMEPPSVTPPARTAHAVAERERPGRSRAQLGTATESSPEPTSARSALARESQLLGSAIAKLRRDGDAEQALVLLDQYRAEFPAPALGQEAAATRIEALLRLGRNGPALALLDAQSLSARGVDREMLVARAELRASKDRCPAAIRDFDQLLAVRGQSDPVAERALFGRAGCRAKSGDVEGARGDYQQYIKAFPQGRFASQARAALGNGSR